MTGNLVSTAWLEAHLGAPDLAIIDASWHLPPAKRDPKAEFLAGHIPSAQFFDIDEIADTASPLPHMLPSPEKFASRVGALGIGNPTRVICYDAAGLFSAARPWWMFRVFGHDNVALLDGGLVKWRAEGRPLEAGPAMAPVVRSFTATLRPAMVRTKADVAAGSAQIADARSPARFRAEEPEPRPGIRGGHIPGARNVHYASLLNPDASLKSPAEIAAVFARAGVDVERPVITSCGSGVTAAILSLGLTLIGAPDHALYDGSWMDWGGDPAVPAETGP